MTDTTPPTVDEIKQVVMSSDWHTPAAALLVLTRLFAAIESGAYALISREDREAAITAAIMCGTNQAGAAFYHKTPASADLRATAEFSEQTARQCLQLKEPA